MVHFQLTFVQFQSCEAFSAFPSLFVKHLKPLQNHFFSPISSETASSAQEHLNSNNPISPHHVAALFMSDCKCMLLQCILAIFNSSPANALCAPSKDMKRQCVSEMCQMCQCLHAAHVCSLRLCCPSTLEFNYPI